MKPKYPKHGRIKEKRLKSPAHLEAIRALPCCCCFEDRSDMSRNAHHLMHGQVRGTGLKAPDSATIPMCSLHHDGLHRNGDETAYLASHGIKDASGLAKALYDATGSYDAMLSVLGGVA